MKKNLLIMIFFGVALITKAQDVATDNSGGYLFSIPSNSPIGVQFSGQNVSLSSTFITFHRETFVYTIGNDTTIQTRSGITASAKILQANINNISLGTLPDIFAQDILELSFFRTVDGYKNPPPFGFFTYSAGAFFVHQQLNTYDTVLKLFPVPKTINNSMGLEASLNYFINHSNVHAFVLALSAKYTNQINTNTLTSYQDLGNTFYEDKNIATNGKTNGYVAPILAPWGYRFSLSVPYFHRLLGTTLSLLPYYYSQLITSGTEKSYNQNMGIILDFFPQNIFGTSGAIRKTNSLQFKNSIGIGFNLFNIPSKKEVRYCFLQGSINFGTAVHNVHTPVSNNGLIN